MKQAIHAYCDIMPHKNHALFQEFLIWLMSYMLEFLYPGGGFPSRTMALCNLTLVFEIMEKEDSSGNITDKLYLLIIH